MATRTVVALLLTALAVCARADDWPRWRGADGTAHVAADAPVPSTLAAQPNVVWKLSVGTGYAAPIVAGATLYYLDNQQDKEVLHAVEAATGKERWRVTLDDVHRDTQPTGPRTAPTVDGDRIYAQSCRGELRCLAVEDGKQIWRTNFVKEFGATLPAETGPNLGATRHGNTASPLVDNAHLIVAVGAPGASLVCFDKMTGKVLWKSQNDAAGYTGPLIATLAGVRQLVDFTAEALIGLDPATGALLWRVPLKTAFGRHAMTPLVVGDTVVVGSQTIGLVGVKVTKSDSLHAEKAWSTSAMGVNFSSPVTMGNRIIGMGPANSLFCADGVTGDKVWAKPLFFAGMAHSEWASFLVMKDRVLTLTDEGQLLLLAPSAADCAVVSQTKVCGNNWCLPAYAHGCLYVKDATELKCLRLAQ